MGSPGPSRGQSDLADMVEMLLDKGVVINADIAVSIGETELLGVQVRAALASFETAAEYGLEFPEGTDMERVEAAASGRSRRQDEEEAEEEEEEAEGGEAEREEEEEVAAVADADGSADATAGGGASEPGSPNRVAIRPHATTGDGGSESDTGEDDEEDDGDD